MNKLVLLIPQSLLSQIMLAAYKIDDKAMRLTIATNKLVDDVTQMVYKIEQVQDRYHIT